MSADDVVKIIGAVSIALVAIMGGIGSLWVRLHMYEQKVNGRMDELLELTRTSARAQGKLDASVDDTAT